MSSPRFSVKLRNKNIKGPWISAIMLDGELNNFYLDVRGKRSLANLETFSSVIVYCVFKIPHILEYSF